MKSRKYWDIRRWRWRNIIAKSRRCGKWQRYRVYTKRKKLSPFYHLMRQAGTGKIVSISKLRVVGIRVGGGLTYQRSLVQIQYRPQVVIKYFINNSRFSGKRLFLCKIVKNEQSLSPNYHLKYIVSLCLNTSLPEPSAVGWLRIKRKNLSGQEDCFGLFGK